MRKPIYVGLAITALATGCYHLALAPAAYAQGQADPALEHARAPGADQRVQSPIPVFAKFYYVILTTATGDGLRRRANTSTSTSRAISGRSVKSAALPLERARSPKWTAMGGSA